MGETSILDRAKEQDATVTFNSRMLRVTQRYLIDLVKPAIELAEEFTRTTRDMWGALRQEGFEGRVGEVHAFRETFLQIIDQRLEFIREALPTARAVAILAGGKETNLAREIESGLADLENFREELFSRWKTQEDLEDILVELYPAPKAHLEAIRQKLPSHHAEWYAEDSKPF